MTIITNQECFDKDTSTRLNEDLRLDLGTTLRYYNDTLSMYCIIDSIRSCWNMLKLSKHVSCAGFPLIGIYDQWMTRRPCAKVHLGLPVRGAVCCKYRASQSAEVGGL